MEHGIGSILAELESDPVRYAAECERRYEAQITEAAKRIYELRDKRPIVLLAGPSGSGKTTTAIKLTHALNDLGIGSVSVSMDGYFIDYDPTTAPRTPDGSRDLESPLCLDLELMGKQFRELTEGKEVIIPHFDFAKERRSTEKFTPLRLGKNEVAIFEGINALNDVVTEFRGVFSFKLYVSVVSNIVDDGKVIYSSQTARLLRRIIRDYNYRAASPEYTLFLWKNVLRGEKLYIEPNRCKADFQIDTFLPYETAVIRKHAMPLIADIPELGDVWLQLSRFPEADDGIVKSDSLLREFIGGSIYAY